MSLGFSEDKEKLLTQRMRALKVYEKDITESFVRSSGPGGQNVNKVATCVVLIHTPTETRIKCQTARTQGANRYYARKALVEKIEKSQAQFKAAKKYALAKKKRQNRKRSKAEKEKILGNKRKRSEKKSLRQKLRPGQND